MRTRGRGSRQDGPHLATLADRSLSMPCLQSPALLWTSQARCQRPGQLQPRRSPRTRSPGLDAIPSTASRRSPFLADPRAHRPSHPHRPDLDVSTAPTLWTTGHPFPFLSKLSAFDRSRATLGFRPALVFRAPSVARRLAPKICAGISDTNHCISSQISAGTITHSSLALRMCSCMLTANGGPAPLDHGNFPSRRRQRG